MATVKTSWATQDEVIPNADAYQTYKVAILQNDVVIEEASEPRGVTAHDFLDFDPGDYVARLRFVDGADQDAMPPILRPFTIPPAPTAPVPVEFSVNLG